MELDINQKRTGGTIDSWCGKCKLVLAHTIEALVGDRPVRVHCNTCNSQHAYKASEPVKSSRSQSSKPRTNRYQGLLKGSNAEAPKIYSPKDKYQSGDVLKHPTFGVGITTAVKDEGKIEVLFEGGSKVLVHGR
jgi:hypothetical protein